MSEWVWLALGGLNLLGLLGLLFRAKAAPLAQEDKLAEQAAWQQQQFAALQAQTERLERELRTGLVWSMAMAGGTPSTLSTAGLSMRSKNCRA